MESGLDRRSKYSIIKVRSSDIDSDLDSTSKSNRHFAIIDIVSFVISAWTSRTSPSRHSSVSRSSNPVMMSA